MLHPPVCRWVGYTLYTGVTAEQPRMLQKFKKSFFACIFALSLAKEIFFQIPGVLFPYALKRRR